MQTFDQSIFSLYQQGFVTLDEALRWASNVDEFKLKVQGISTTGEWRATRWPEGRHRHAGDHEVRRIAPAAERAWLPTSTALAAARPPRAVRPGRAQPAARPRIPRPEISTPRSTQLLETGALDDGRVARAYARTAVDR